MKYIAAKNRFDVRVVVLTLLKVVELGTAVHRALGESQ